MSCPCDFDKYNVVMWIREGFWTWHNYMKVIKHDTEFMHLHEQWDKLCSKQSLRSLDLTRSHSGKLFTVLITHHPFFSSDCQNSMDMCRIAAVGHSFGGATVIEALCKEVKFKYVDSYSTSIYQPVSLTWSRNIIKYMWTLWIHRKYLQSISK